jgi:hypothetical protein
MKNGNPVESIPRFDYLNLEVRASFSATVSSLSAYAGSAGDALTAIGGQFHPIVGDGGISCRWSGPQTQILSSVPATATTVNCGPVPNITAGLYNIEVRLGNSQTWFSGPSFFIYPWGTTGTTGSTGSTGSTGTTGEAFVFCVRVRPVVVF